MLLSHLPGGKGNGASAERALIAMENLPFTFLSRARAHTPPEKGMCAKAKRMQNIQISRGTGRNEIICFIY